MAREWTYEGPTDDKGKVRLMIGDTDSTDQQLYDDEIEFFLTQQGTVLSAAIQSARAIAAKYARQMDKAVGPFRESASVRFAHYTQLAVELEAQLTAGGVAVYAGGTSVSDRDSRESDSDRIAPAFTRELFDNPGTATSGWSDNTLNDL